MSNRLAASTSPSLRQHADNPVDRREWGEDAFAEARERDAPTFLGIGWSSRIGEPDAVGPPLAAVRIRLGGRA